jgi:hypothetical protein
LDQRMGAWQGDILILSTKTGKPSNKIVNPILKKLEEFLNHFGYKVDNSIKPIKLGCESGGGSN